jgi:alpha-galactosidase
MVLSFKYGRYILSALVLLCLVTRLSAQSSAAVKQIPFGKNNRISYDLYSGTYSVWVNGKMLIKDAFSWYEDARQPDTARIRRSFSVAPLKDPAGTGKQYVISSLENGITKEQRFYVYNGDNGFYTALVLRGTGARSRSMSPLTTTSLQFTGSDTFRAVQVPFDNDTWVKYSAADLPAASFTSAEVTALYNTTGNNGMVIGSVEHNNWKTGIALKGATAQTAALSVIAGWTDSTGTRDRIPHGIVTSGDTLCASPKVYVWPGNDWRTGMEQYAQANRKAEPRYIFNWTAAKPFGWNSWGSMQTKLSLAKAKTVADFFADSCKGFRNADHTLYIDLDSYWDNLTTHGMTGDFSQLEAFSAYCKSKGFKPGIYWAPFVDWGKSPRTVEGSRYNYEDTWTKVNGQYHELDGARAMDPTHPATRERIAFLIKRFKDAGFEMIKIDFIGHAAIEADHFYDPAVHTGMQAFRKGMEYLVDQLDGKMLVYAAISPNMATGRYVHTRRIACDAFKNIDETAYTLNGTSYGWWQNLLYDFADADHVVFEGAANGANKARLLSGIITGSLITGDDFSVYSHASEAAKQLLQNQELLEVARQGGVFRPVDHHVGQQSSNIFVKNSGRYTYVAVINYAATSATFSVALQQAGLSAKDVYSAKELFSGKTSAASNTMQITLPAADAVIYQLIRTK